MTKIRKPRVALVGCYQSGKSSALELLMGNRYAAFNEDDTKTKHVVRDVCDGKSSALEFLMGNRYAASNEDEAKTRHVAHYACGDKVTYAIIEADRSRHIVDHKTFLDETVCERNDGTIIESRKRRGN